VEEEIKVRVAALEPVRQRLREQRAALVHPRAFEENFIVDDAEERIFRGGRLLRVRRWGEEGFVTFKGRATFQGGVKQRAETQCRVDDPQALLEILAQLGLRVTRRYQKWREAWQLEGVEVVLDETPMGPFVELEGPAELLRPLARTLGLDPDGALAGSYSELWVAWRRSHPEAPVDMVFPP
jgi:adenylate cyclase class 2